MNGDDETPDYRAQRRRGIVYIATAMPIAAGLWLAIDRLAPPLAGMESLEARMLFTLKCWACAVLFCLVTGVEAVAHERLVSPAFDPLSRFQTSRLQVNLRYLQNTLEQTVVFAAALFGLAVYSRLAPRCARWPRPPSSGLCRASRSGSAITGAPPCEASARRGWR